MKKISRPTPAHNHHDSSLSANASQILSSPLRSTKTREISYEQAVIPPQYPHRLSLYLQAPAYEITIEDFEELALARLELLKAVETAGIRNLREDELYAWIRKYEQKHLPLHYNNVAARFALFDERRRDESAHFILKLAFCGAVPNETHALADSSSLNTAEDGRRWFVNQETGLLRYRLQQMNAENRLEREEFLSHCLRAFTSESADSIKLLGHSEKTALMDQLRAIHAPEVLNEDFYNCPWELVPDLVAKRAVLLNRGRAVVPRSECASIVLNRFKEELEISLEALAREIPFLRDDRIVPLLDALRRCDYSLDAAMASSSGASVIGQLAAADVDKASVHFPLCMQNLHRNLRADRHLKFAGRQQFGLFLKSIGLSLSEALIFWRTAFLPKTSPEQFNKDYAYNVRHNYGQEGKRANYSSYSCGKICTTSTTPGEYHGCPYKHAGSVDKLSNILALYTGPNGIKLTAPQIKEVASLAVEGSHYQLACTRVFEMTRPKQGTAPAETVTYPHKYYEASIQSCGSMKKMSYLDVFRDFEYEDEGGGEGEEALLEQTAFQDAFSQLLNDDQPPSQSSNNITLPSKPTEEQPKATLQDYEEAFTVLKSIEEAHSPFNYTAINAYLHYQRGLDTNKRSVEGVCWPEHPDSFQDTHLLTDKTTDNGACSMSLNPQLQIALSKACKSIWRQKTMTRALDPLLLDSITQRTALLLQFLLDRTVLNRKSAIKVLKQFPLQTDHVDVDNVPADWKSTREAARQLIGQAALDQDTFIKFASRLDAMFPAPNKSL